MSIAIGIAFVVLVLASLALRRLKLRSRKVLAAKHDFQMGPTKQMKPYSVEPLNQPVPPINPVDVAPLTRHTRVSQEPHIDANQAATMFVLGTVVGSTIPDDDERRRDEEQRRRDEERDDESRRDNERTQDEQRDRDNSRYEERSADANHDSVGDSNGGSWD